MFLKKRIYSGDKKQDGFTLIEILIAIAILSFGILAIASMQSSSLRSTQHSYNVTEGTTLAQDRIEELMTLPYNAVVNGTAVNGNYTIGWTVATGVPVTNTKTVTVTVSWTAAGGAQKVSSLQYIIADII
jgi:type IV pilus modification protein PilV